MKNRNIWIAFEGIDGCGKTTQIKKCVEALKAQGLKVVETREPGGNEYSEVVRKLIFNPEVAEDPISQLYLFDVARRRNIFKIVLPAWKENQIIISDRSEGSTFAYQHFQFGLPWNKVKEINDYATEGVKPTLTILLDVDVEIGLKRTMQTRGEILNHFDQANIGNITKRRKGYLKLVKNYKKYKLNSWIKVDANKSQEEVYQEILKVLKHQGIIK